MELYDALSGGVDPGGLRSRNDIKTTICYLVRALNGSLTKEQLYDVMTTQNVANYFEVSDALSALVNRGVLRFENDCNNVEYLQITTYGEAALARIEKNLPPVVREKVINEGVRLVTISKNSIKNHTSIEPCNGGYNVRLSINDENGEELVQLKLYVASLSQAELVKNRFLEDPVTIYSYIVSKLY